MRGSVWVYLRCYLTARNGRVFGQDKVYGYAEVRQINTINQQKLQYYRAVNKALATYRANNNLDSDTEVGYSVINDGIIYEGKENGKTIKKRKESKLTPNQKGTIHKQIMKGQKLTITEKELKPSQRQSMYKKKVSIKEYKKIKKVKKYKKKKPKNYY